MKQTEPTDLIISAIYEALQDSLVPHLNASCFIKINANVIGGEVSLFKEISMLKDVHTYIKLIIQARLTQIDNKMLYLWTKSETAEIDLRDPELIEKITTAFWRAYNGINPVMEYK